MGGGWRRRCPWVPPGWSQLRPNGAVSDIARHRPADPFFGKAATVLEFKADVVPTDPEPVGDGPTHLFFGLDEAVATPHEIVQGRDEKRPTPSVCRDFGTETLHNHASILSGRTGDAARQ